MPPPELGPPVRRRGNGSLAASRRSFSVTPATQALAWSQRAAAVSASIDFGRRLGAGFGGPRGRPGSGSPSEAGSELGDAAGLGPLAAGKSTERLFHREVVDVCVPFPAPGTAAADPPFAAFAGTTKSTSSSAASRASSSSGAPSSSPCRPSGSRTSSSPARASPPSSPPSSTSSGPWRATSRTSTSTCSSWRSGWLPWTPTGRSSWSSSRTGGGRWTAWSRRAPGCGARPPPARRPASGPRPRPSSRSTFSAR